MLQESVVVSASPSRVWESVVGFEERPKWAPRVKEARLLDGTPLRQGSRIRLKIDRDQFTATVADIQDLKHLTLLVKGPGFRVTHRYELAPEGSGTRLTLTATYGGIIGSLVARFMRASVRRDLVEELGAIKKAAEAVAPR